MAPRAFICGCSSTVLTADEEAFIRESDPWGLILFKRTIRGHLQLSHLVGIGLLVALIPFAHSLTPLMLSAATTAIMLLVAVWEAVSLGAAKRAPAHGQSDATSA